MNTNAKHTQLPWDFNGAATIASTPNPGVDWNDAKFVAVVCIDKRYTCLSMPDIKEQQANAEFIVRACNSHYELVGACKSALRALKDNLCPGPMGGDAIKALEIVLTSAQGKEN